MANKTQLILHSDGAGNALIQVPTLASDQQYVLPATAGTLALQGAVSDMLSAILNAEVAVSSGGTVCVADTWYKCTATGANYAIGLPPVAANSGKFVGIRIDPSSTFLVTVTGNSTEAIDGQNTRIMWAKESCVLYCDGTAWTKVAGKAIPMEGSLVFPSNQTFAAATTTALNFNTSLFNNAPAAFQTAAASRFNILRPGLYNIMLAVACSSTNASASQVVSTIYKNGAQAAYAAEYASATLSVNMACELDGSLCAAGDTFLPYGAYGSGSFATSYLVTDGSGNYNQFTVTEIPTW